MLEPNFGKFSLNKHASQIKLSWSIWQQQSIRLGHHNIYEASSLLPEANQINHIAVDGWYTSSVLHVQNFGIPSINLEKYIVAAKVRIPSNYATDN